MATSEEIERASLCNGRGFVIDAKTVLPGNTEDQ